MYSLHELSGGRARMGIGIGAAAVEDVGAKPTKVADLASAVASVRELWSGNELCLDGAKCRLQYAASDPKAIPIYLAASAPRLTRLSGEIADGLLCNIGVEPRQISATLRTVEQGALSAGREPRDVKVAARIPACISDDADSRFYVRARVATAALRRAPSEFNEEDLQTLQKIRQAYDPREHLRLNAAYAEQVTDSLIDKFALAGRPEECLERVRAIVETGIDELNMAFMHPDTEKLLRIFAEQIIAKL
jgi:5,10-methylenetetrahydromethanopterin reductase